MKATVSFLQQRFATFNELIFEGKLPLLPIELSNARTFMGKCEFKKRRKLWGKTECYDYKIRISTRYDLPEQELDDVLIHEMIHYYIAWNGIKDSSAHGKVFRKWMTAINAIHHRNITISHRTTASQREQAVAEQPRYRVVAVVSFNDGRIGIKVLPRVLPSILNYYNKVLTSKEVQRISLFMTNNAFFGHYPCSSALKVYFIAHEELARHLQGAEHMACDGKRILRNA